MDYPFDYLDEKVCIAKINSIHFELQKINTNAPNCLTDKELNDCYGMDQPQNSIYTLKFEALQKLVDFTDDEIVTSLNNLFKINFFEDKERISIDLSNKKILFDFSTP